MKFILVIALLFMSAVAKAALAADGPPLSPELQKLDVFVGHWEFHGQTLDTAFGKPGAWIWNEDCRWSDDRGFLLCSFANVWSGKPVNSLVVDTYNNKDHGYWHYELFAGGQTGSRPFISKMTVAGNTWTEYGEDADHGKKISERITYRYSSTNEVDVAILVSRDGSHWITVDRGHGVKKP
ncbi:MAG: hypothetical protein KGJ08_02035 [Gammaproteobacteria bacterium]|nr:hypothetical protein [Gammaproteobacteria bacterium]